MYAVSPFFLIVIISQVVLLCSFPTDNLDLFDTAQTSPFVDENEFLMTNAPNSCVTSNDLSLTDETITDETTSNLFVRDDGPRECLPPVNIGADTKQLFEDPLNFLKDHILPSNDGETASDPIIPLKTPGQLPDNEIGEYDAEEMKKQGW